mmetsp:Transcript_5914/g.11175  ORF Transcript_5914/g.11175 Transcript_5914/m.11175 type:complete len:426 (-) Transcript_5914:191-1468(-)
MGTTEDQLRDIAGQIKSRVQIAITQIKKNTSSTPLDPHGRDLDQGSSPSLAQDSNPNQDTRILSTVFQTLFSACTGNRCPEPPSETIERRTSSKLGKKARNALHNLQQTSSRDECHYAQFYEDDHGRAARAVLMTRQREEKQRNEQRQKMKHMNRNAVEEQAGKRFTMNQSGGQKSEYIRNHGKTTASTFQQGENIRVGGYPYRLCEVRNILNRSATSEDSESALSYNYDDGISAISAHTLEEMAKAEMIFQRKIGVPREEGFDIALDSTENGVTFGKDLPPSPTSTEDSSSTMDDVARIQDIVDEQLERSYKKKDDCHLYPVQMARPRSHRSTESTESSTRSDHSEWKKQDTKYWMQVVQEEQYARDEPSITPKKERHPHDTSFLATHSLSSSSKKKRGRRRTPKLFGRRKKYLECEDDGEYEI